MTQKIILASASPRRAELLAQIGVKFDALPVDIDETPHHDELPHDYVRRLALEKAQAAKLLSNKPDMLVLGSDTSVIIDGEILGKPEDKEHAKDMLNKLSGRTHSVLTSVALLGDKDWCTVSENKVTFAILSDSDFEQYWATGEPLGKAGAYAIQGKAAVFIKKLEGSFSGVMGLPLYETAQLLRKAGYSID